MTCDACGQEFDNMRGAIIAGKFGQYCENCINGVRRQPHVGAAAYNRARDHDDHELDLLQPWDGKGNPSTEFIRHYPDESKDMFTPEELAQHG